MGGVACEHIRFPFNAVGKNRREAEAGALSVFVRRLMGGGREALRDDPNKN